MSYNAFKLDLAYFNGENGSINCVYIVFQDARQSEIMDVFYFQFKTRLLIYNVDILKAGYRIFIKNSTYKISRESGTITYIKVSFSFLFAIIYAEIEYTR